jgi:hypothetical protein
VKTARPCVFDFRNGDRGRLQCREHGDHVVLLFADPSSRPAKLVGMLDRGALTGEAESEALELLRLVGETR